MPQSDLVIYLTLWSMETMRVRTQVGKKTENQARLVSMLKGQSQLAHMRIKYYFILN